MNKISVWMLLAALLPVLAGCGGGAAPKTAPEVSAAAEATLPEETPAQGMLYFLFRLSVTSQGKKNRASDKQSLALIV